MDPCGDGVAASSCIDDTVTDTEKSTRQYQLSTDCIEQSTCTFVERSQTLGIEDDFCWDTVIATHRQSLVDMMVDLNMVYLAAIGPLLGLRLLNVHVSDRTANTARATGFGIAMTCYLIRRTGLVVMLETTTLLVSFPFSLVALVVSRPRTMALPNESQNQPVHPPHSPGIPTSRER
jgi:hypothetical protein